MGDKHIMKPIYHFKHYKQGYPRVWGQTHNETYIYHFNTTNKDTQMGDKHSETYLPFQHYKQGYPEYGGQTHNETYLPFSTYKTRIPRVTGGQTHNETYLPFQHYKQGYPEYGDKHIMKPIYHFNTTNKDTQSMGDKHNETYLPFQSLQTRISRVWGTNIMKPSNFNEKPRVYHFNTKKQGYPELWGTNT
ncbi:unnamed protein product [Mytilus edulis]|uniref:Uncharacterized protein n=1 Tax=Mytilus edulis TaxID=6550 RepID=A0A8S3U7S7_MYTED|nr:unnamed protein product [Mytilus edulis]